MTWRRPLDEALDGQEPGPTRVDGPHGAHADVDVQEADRIGVRVGEVRVRHAEDRDPADEAARLTRDVRSLSDRLRAVEVDGTLGGAVLRSEPEEGGRRDDFWEVRVDGPREVEVRRYMVDGDGGRAPAGFDLTREQLGRLLGELDGS